MLTGKNKAGSDESVDGTAEARFNLTYHSRNNAAEKRCCSLN